MSEELLLAELSKLATEEWTQYHKAQELCLHLIDYAKTHYPNLEVIIKQRCVLLTLGNLYEADSAEHGEAFMLLCKALFTDPGVSMTKDEITRAMQLSQKYPYMLPDNWDALW